MQRTNSCTSGSARSASAQLVQLSAQSEHSVIHRRSTARSRLVGCGCVWMISRTVTSAPPSLSLWLCCNAPSACRAPPARRARRTGCLYQWATAHGAAPLVKGIASQVSAGVLYRRRVADAGVHRLPDPALTRGRIAADLARFGHGLDDTQPGTRNEGSSRTDHRAISREPSRQAALTRSGVPADQPHSVASIPSISPKNAPISPMWSNPRLRTTFPSPSRGVSNDEACSPSPPSATARCELTTPQQFLSSPFGSALRRQSPSHPPSQ
jgi:hypothetical protein